MKHAACGGVIEIRTDPKNTRYEVFDGGKARDYGEDKVREGDGGVPILTEEERKRRREDAFAQLEGKVEEKQAVKDNARRIEELYRDKDRDWEDTWSANRRLRDSFRRERKVRKREEEATEKLKERLGTDMEILPAVEEDARRAELVDFGGVKDGEATTKSMFQSSRSVSIAETDRNKLSKESRADVLRRQLLSNTRAAINPFGATGTKT